MSSKFKEISAAIGSAVGVEAAAFGEIIKGQIVLAAILTVIPLGLWLFGGEPPDHQKKKK